MTHATRRQTINSNIQFTSRANKATASNLFPLKILLSCGHGMTKARKQRRNIAQSEQIKETINLISINCPHLI